MHAKYKQFYEDEAAIPCIIFCFTAMDLSCIYDIVFISMTINSTCLHAIRWSIMDLYCSDVTVSIQRRAAALQTLWNRVLIGKRSLC